VDLSRLSASTGVPLSALRRQGSLSSTNTGPAHGLKGNSFGQTGADAF
jgi:hypothetical protein